MSMPIAAGPMIWATKLPIRANALELLDEWEQEIARLLRGQSLRIRCSSRCAHTIRALRHSHRAVFRSAHRVSPGPDRAPLRHLGRRARLLPLFGESGGPPGALSLRLSRRRAPAAFRCHLHGVAAREFLAGCFARSREGTHLHSAGCAGARTASRKTTSMRGGSTRATFR